GRYGKCCGCIETVHVLIRGDLPDLGSYFATAHVMATRSVIGQESAEAIPGARKQALKKINLSPFSPKINLSPFSS
ncbi:MAG: hypothetical protein ABFD06_06370, partial [Smithella sp.]